MKLKPPGRLIAHDYPRIMALWQAAGLHVRPKGRDSREAFERQIASGIQTVIGIETEQGDLIGVVLVTHDSRKGLIEPENTVSLKLFQATGYSEWPGMHYLSKRRSSDA